MSKFIKTIAVVASLFAAGSAFANDCGEVLFYGKTMNHKKEVRICVFSSSNQNYIQYRFGKVGQKPELEFIQPAKKVKIDYHTPYFGFNSSMELTNGTYGYNLGAGMGDDGAGSGYLVVYNKGKELANIKLDYSTIENGIDESITKYGVYDYIEEGYNPEFKLAIPRD